MPTVVVMTGGGIKGAAAAARYAADNALILVHVDYGQSAAPAELSALQSLAGAFASSRVLSLTMPHVLELDRGLAGAAELLRSDGDRGAGEPGAPSAGALRGLMPTLMTLGLQCALRVAASTVATGLSRYCDAAHLGLGAAGAAPDGRCEFVHALNLMTESLTRASLRVRIEAPLIEMPLAQIVKLARHFGVSLERTWTCEQTGTSPCGLCEPCKSRARAFTEAALVDPLVAPVPASAVGVSSK